MFLFCPISVFWFKMNQMFTAKESLRQVSSIPKSLKFRLTIFTNPGEYSYTCSLVTLNQIGRKMFSFLIISRAKTDSNSFFVQPSLFIKLGLIISTHFLHFLMPVSILLRKLSPTFSENSSYHTGQSLF